MLTAIIDYGSGNLHSAYKAFEKITASNNLGSVIVTSDPKIISSADRLVLPGDGAFPSCKSELMRLKHMKPWFIAWLRNPGLFWVSVSACN